MHSTKGADTLWIQELFCWLILSELSNIVCADEFSPLSFLVSVDRRWPFAPLLGCPNVSTTVPSSEGGAMSSTETISSGSRFM